MIRIEDATIEQINRALQAIETLARGGGKTAPEVIRNQSASVNWANIINKPAVFPPASHEDVTGDHTHEISDVNGLSAALSWDAGHRNPCQRRR